MTIDLNALERKAKAALGGDDTSKTYAEICALEDWRDAATPPTVLALIDRVRGLERVARAVRSITADLAKNGFGADCPYVSQEEAVELLAIIDGVNGG